MSARPSAGFLHPLWNTYAFFVTYANIDGWRPSNDPQAPKPDLDRWILSELNELIERETAALDDYDATAAARALERFVDVLSNWYVRRSRRRFWSSARTGAAADLEAKTSAYETLHAVLTTLARLLAPLTPYLAEEMWRNLVAEQDQSATESVHLADWPAADADQIDHALNDEMALVQRVASLGRAARSSAGIRVRPAARRRQRRRPQRRRRHHRRAPRPHNRPTNSTSNRSALPRPAQTRAATRSSPICECSAPASARNCPALRGALTSLPAELASHIAQTIEAGQTVEIEGIALGPDDLLIESEAGGDSAAASAEDEVCSVSLDTDVSESLAQEGLVREVIHRIQNLRRDSGLHPADRIALTLATGDEELGAALATFEDLIATETLATDIALSASERTHQTSASIDGAQLHLSLDRA